ncbi:MAG: hypothetical protein ACK5P6_00030 [Pseudobdellovibrionaceae bacterium]
MAKTAILPLKKIDIEIDIYSNKSSLLLFWLLAQHEQMKKEGFSVNEAAREAGLSVGLAHKVIRQLEFNGFVITKGLRTSKKFFLKSPDKILKSWVQEYSLIRKTKTKGFATQQGIKSKMKEYGLIPALHLASAELFHVKSTNLKLKEYYLPDWGRLPKIVSRLQLEELDRGYELLLIKPYYSALLEKLGEESTNKIWKDSYAILTILDLAHFPVRGIEQAETLFRKSDLSSICNWQDLERAIG